MPAIYSPFRNRNSSTTLGDFLDFIALMFLFSYPTISAKGSKDTSALPNNGGHDSVFFRMNATARYPCGAGISVRFVGVSGDSGIRQNDGGTGMT
jgi:hypothetical protein